MGIIMNEMNTTTLEAITEDVVSVQHLNSEGDSFIDVLIDDIEK